MLRKLMFFNFLSINNMIVKIKFIFFVLINNFLPVIIAQNFVE